MRFTTNTKDLKIAIEWITNDIFAETQFLERQPVLPISENLLFHNKGNDTLKIVWPDPDNPQTVTMPTHIIIAGSVVVNSDKLLKILRKIEGDLIYGESILINNNKLKFIISDLKNNYSLTTNKSALNKVINTLKSKRKILNEIINSLKK